MREHFQIILKFIFSRNSFENILETYFLKMYFFNNKKHLKKKSKKKLQKKLKKELKKNEKIEKKNFFLKKKIEKEKENQRIKIFKKS